MRTTRLAPSPTGSLHLGNARTFLANWLLARQKGWKIVLRIEDLDGPRVKAGAGKALIDDLQWLGIDWDEGPVYQSHRTASYIAALQILSETGHTYPCICSRKEVHAAASAPHAEDGSAVYPGTCRGRYTNTEQAQTVGGRVPAVRFAVPPGRTVQFDDNFMGRQSFDVTKELGDFVVAKADGTPAYQLAVVVDDAAAEVTDVVRGDDLLDSTPRQILIYEALGLGEQIPTYYHLPLVVGTDGRRLAKRHGDTRLSAYRQAGVPAERLVILLASWIGIGDLAEAVTLNDLVGRFDLQSLPRAPIVFDKSNDLWLRSPHKPSNVVENA